MATVADCRRDISYNGLSKYYCVCGYYANEVVDETKHCSKTSKYDNMEVVEVLDRNSEYELWVLV